MPYKCIAIDEAKILIETREVALADIRDARSFADASICDSVNVSEANVEEFLTQTNQEKPIIVICYHGNSSKGAAEYFFGRGYKEVYSLDGGFEAWRQVV